MIVHTETCRVHYDKARLLISHLKNDSGVEVRMIAAAYTRIY
jgi:hypothetical protein